MVLRHALESARLGHHPAPGDTVRYAHPLNEHEEGARFLVLGLEAGRALIRNATTGWVGTIASWEITAAEAAL